MTGRRAPRAADWSRVGPAAAARAAIAAGKGGGGPPAGCGHGFDGPPAGRKEGRKEAARLEPTSAAMASTARRLRAGEWPRARGRRGAARRGPDLSRPAGLLWPTCFESRLSSTRALGKQPTHCFSGCQKGLGLDLSERNRQPGVTVLLSSAAFWMGKVDGVGKRLWEHRRGRGGSPFCKPESQAPSREPA